VIPRHNRKSVAGNPLPTVRAPVLDPTDERDVETEQGKDIEAPTTERVGNTLGLAYTTAPHPDSTKLESAVRLSSHRQVAKQSPKVTLSLRS